MSVMHLLAKVTDFLVSVQGQGDGLLNSVRVSCFCPLSCGKSDTKPLAVGIVSWH